ncbi:hypothetical protein NLU13_8259 [Sarocladium strictum]|uniref:Uncharacterized protein n=1 Tax=Sarocladium strictum TaxID=5046 RepID=A0AA39GBN9_SARSR|nr:hypothetical protein NLU13_8259 [Sarocladium strictum]
MHIQCTSRSTEAVGRPCLFVSCSHRLSSSTSATWTARDRVTGSKENCETNTSPIGNNTESCYQVDKGVCQPCSSTMPAPSLRRLLWLVGSSKGINPIQRTTANWFA